MIMQMVTTGEEKLGERYKSRIDIKNNCLYKSEQQDNQQEIILLFIGPRSDHSLP